MRAPQAGFDPFQHHGWIPFETRGIAAVEREEAPLLMYALDLAEPSLAADLAKIYESDGLQPADLRVGVWADARPQPRRQAHQPPAIHLNVFGSSLLTPDQATPPERAALNALTFVTVRHIREIIDPPHGITVQEFGRQAPTMHRHIIAREQPEDGLDWTRERPVVDLDHRRTVADLVSFDLVPERKKGIVDYLTQILQASRNRNGKGELGIPDPF